MFENRILIGLSPLLHDHIAYEIAIAKITTVVMWEQYSIQDCGETVPHTTIREIWMSVENVRKLEQADKFGRQSGIYI